MKYLILSSFFCIALVCYGEVVHGAEYRFDPLPYAVDALEPHIDKETMDIHYNRHHRGYYQNLTKALEGSAWQEKSLEQLLASVSELPAVIRNNGGGHWNHAMFWKMMSPNGGGAPKGKLGAEIDKTFGSFSAFKQEFKQAALGRFGSGWTWLCVSKDGKLFITTTPNQDNPLMDVADEQGTPILGLDVWEHAYYLKHQNNRGAYIDAFWNVANWEQVSSRYNSSR